ncbi:hypothetical protein C0991_000952 [Blastosporella zonata]|nr:hypothetical protein C0991_000952 [Blastosporella zonata]
MTETKRFWDTMPHLTSLSVDACKGVRSLMASFIGPSAYVFTDPRKRRHVKVCSRLEAMSFWNSEDVDFSDVRKVVMASNNHESSDEIKALECGQKVVRKIEPLKRLRHKGLSEQASTSDLGTGSMEDTLGVCHTSCAQLLREEATTLSQLGVVDVVYNE